MSESEFNTSPQPDVSPSGNDAASPQSAKSRALELSLTKKQRRIGERVIELGIFAVAAVSIISIFLIFFFIFREAAPIFFGGDKQDTVAAAPAPAQTSAPKSAATDTGSGQMEVYNPESGSVGSEGAKSGASTDTAGGQMEVYNPESGSIGGDTAGAAKSGTSTASADTSMEVYNPSSGSIPSAPTSATHDAAKAKADALRIVGNDYPILEHDSPVKLSYLFYDNWQPNSEHPRYGIYPILIGTLKTTIVALLVATPLAILAALYTAFFSPKWLREILKPALELLAGFPSVVLGFFCLMSVASLVQGIFHVDYRLNAVVGGIGLALAVIPIIYTITDDALRAIPGSLREAALALGASEWQAAYQVILPAATPGIFAAVLLGLGRAFGETMIALMATGNAGTVGWSFFVPVRTFAATIGAEMGEVVFGSPHYQLLFLLGIILFVFSFGINFVTEFYVKQRLIKRFRGG
jgi:phosphate transport system permease protein